MPDDDGVELLIRNLSTASPPKEWTAETAQLLSGLQAPRRHLVKYLEGLAGQHRAMLFDGSHDTSTHYKWLIHRSYEPRFTLWLHEYKEPDARAAGYAQVPHDHRYSIASLIVAGSYLAATWELAGGRLSELARVSYAQGDVMTIEHYEIHSLLEITPGTMTLVVEGPPIKSSSSAYYDLGGAPRVFPDFPARWPSLLGRLSPP